MLRPPHQDDPRRGQALVEFALTLPILLMLVFGIIDLARVMFAYTQVVDASRQAIRHGIVEGLAAPYNQYFDCDAIRDAALDLPGVITLDPTVNIEYTFKKEVYDPATKTLSYTDETVACSSTLNREYFAYKYSDASMPQVEMEVEVTGNVRPVTPVIMPFASSIPIHFTSTRTIVFQGADYTYEWLTPPDKPTGFNATVDCTACDPSMGEPNYSNCVLGLLNNVSFTWDSIGPIPDRVEIRSTSVLATVVAEPDPDYAYCTNCTAIPRANGVGSYYMVVYVGKYPLELASVPSDTATVVCPPIPAGPAPGTISGSVWTDADGNGEINEAKAGINGVTINVTYTGLDRILGTVDDEVFVTTTANAGGNKGVFNFAGLKLGLYSIRADPASAPLAGMNATTTSPLSVELTSGPGENAIGINFGFQTP